jgi:hypothetical protein
LGNQLRGDERWGNPRERRGRVGQPTSEDSDPGNRSPTAGVAASKSSGNRRSRRDSRADRLGDRATGRRRRSWPVAVRETAGTLTRSDGPDRRGPSLGLAAARRPGSLWRRTRSLGAPGDRTRGAQGHAIPDLPRLVAALPPDRPLSPGRGAVSVRVIVRPAQRKAPPSHTWRGLVAFFRVSPPHLGRWAACRPSGGASRSGAPGP